MPCTLADRWRILGCYECSRRRIDCDREEPSCQKCRSKKIQCSGLGIRYRFNHGVASRGKLTGKMLPVLDVHEPQDPCASKGKAAPAAAQNRNGDGGGGRAETETETESESDSDSSVCRSYTAPSIPRLSRKDSSSKDLLETDYTSLIGVGLDHIDGGTRFFLQYCESPMCSSSIG